MCVYVRVRVKLCRRFLRESLERRKLPFGTVSSFILLLIIYTTFCDTFSNPDVELEPTSLLVVVLTSTPTLPRSVSPADPTTTRYVFLV